MPQENLLVVVSHNSFEVAAVSQSVKPPPDRPSEASEERVRWPERVTALRLVVAAPPRFKVVTVELNRLTVVAVEVTSAPLTAKSPAIYFAPASQ